MKRLLLLLAFPVAVLAQPVIPSGYPAPIGTCTKMRVETNNPLTTPPPYGPNKLAQRSGWAYGWVCPPGRILWFAGTWDASWPDWEKKATAAAYAGKSGLDALYAEANIPLAQIVNGSAQFPWGLDSVMVPLWAQLELDKADAFPPPGTEVWKVKPTGTATERVIFTLVNGKRGPLTNPVKYVSIGTVCDQLVRVDEPLGPLLTTYMGVPGGIAVCAKQ